MKRNALLVGFFLILAIAVAVAAVLWLGGGGLFEQRTRAVIYFEDSVRGLYVGAPVTFRGVQVGEVETIGLEMNPSTRKARIPVQVMLRPQALRIQTNNDARRLNIPELVQRGLRAKLLSQSFVTGQQLIDLDLATEPPAAVVAEAGDVPEIPAERGKLDELLKQAGDIDLRGVVADLRRSLETMEKSLSAANALLVGARDQLDQTGLEARRTLQVASQALTQVQAQAGTTLRSIQSLSDTTREAVNKAQPALQASLDSARGAAESARLAADAAQHAMLQLSDVAAPGSNLRAELDTSLRDLSIAARNLRDWTETVADQPNAVIFGKERQ